MSRPADAREAMEVLHYPDDQPCPWSAPIVALGNFDGVHRGHASLIDRVRARAAEAGTVAAVLTFDPHPPRIVRPDKAPPLLMTKAQKLARVGESGLAGAAVVRFTPEVSRWSPETFVRHVLVDWLHASEVWVGANFLFGHDRSGNFSQLRALGARFGFVTDTIEPVRYREFVVSSTRIRRLVAEGEVDEAGGMLGHHYTMSGEVVHGDGRGRRVGFPTANVRTDNEVWPADGVYATTVTVDGVIHPSVTNVGRRPTFEGAHGRTLEAHVFDFEGDLYGTVVDVAFVRRLRAERRFENAEALAAQIVEDCEAARALFDAISR